MMMNKECSCTEEMSMNDDSSEDDSADGECSGLKSWMLSAFPAFCSRNFRLYFVGQIVSMIGTWLQMVALGWLVLEMTGSAFWVGVTAAASTLPTLLFSLFGGVIVDRYDRKTILLWTQILSMVLALVLGVFTLTGAITLVIIMELAFLLGCVTAVATPALQAFLSEMVEHDQLRSAVALNSAILNTSRVIGPVIAGFMISYTGTGGAFLANGVSYIAVILALFAIHTTVPREKVTDSGSPLQSIRDGVVYTWQHPIIRTIVLFASVMSVFGWSFMSMLPVVAKQTYGLGSEGMGYLFSALGLGSLSGTVLVSINSGRVRNSSMVVGGSVTFSLGLIAFSFAQDERLGMIFLFIAGMGILSAFATMTATVQYLVDDRYRGRVMSIYLMVLVGLLPIGNLEVGILSELFGTAVAIRVGSAVVLAAALLLSYSLKEVARAWQAYSEPSES